AAAAEHGVCGQLAAGHAAFGQAESDARPHQISYAAGGPRWRAGALRPQRAGRGHRRAAGQRAVQLPRAARRPAPAPVRGEARRAAAIHGGAGAEGGGRQPGHHGAAHGLGHGTRAGDAASERAHGLGARWTASSETAHQPAGGGGRHS
nr:hypothetical protein [Tanacetum cinerariifolium]